MKRIPPFNKSFGVRVKQGYLSSMTELTSILKFLEEMKMKGTIIKKICAISLAALMIGGAGMTEIGSFVGTSLPVAAATLSSGDYEYWENNDGTVTLTKYIGDKTEVVVPATLEGKKVKAIGKVNHSGDIEGCFNDNKQITKVTISSGITEIEERAFYRCTALKSVSIPGTVKVIGKEAFYCCSSITSVNIPKGVSEISTDAFRGCSGMRSVSIPGTVTSIGSYAFKDCSSLIGVSIPNSVKVINECTFEGCINMQGVTIPKSVTTIAKCAFNGCSKLTSVTIPDSVTKIDTWAFCNTGLTSVTVPQSVTELGSCVFENCTALTNAVINNAFVGIKEFYGCSALTNVTLSDNVTEIQQYAFSNCTGLKAIRIPDSVTSIVGYAFEGCDGMTNITLSKNITAIQECTFQSCTSLTSISIPDKVTLIGESAFGDCSGLTKLILPDGVATIGSQAFSGCTGLTKVTIPGSVGTIGNSAFWDCTGLTYLTISEGVESISSSAFYGCTALTSVVIPNSVILVDGFAFECCSSLEKVTFLNSNTIIDSSEYGHAFIYTRDDLKIIGAKGSTAETYANELGFEFVSLGLLNRSTISSDTFTLGDEVVINCAAAGGTAPYKYWVMVKKSGSDTWKAIPKQDYFDEVSFTPGAATDYDIKVKVKDATGKTVSKTFSLKANKPLKNTSKLSADTVKLGNKIKARGFAEGGDGKYQFAMYYKKASETNWTKLRGYKESNIVYFTPAAATKYNILIKVKDGTGKVVNKTLNLNVTK